MRLIIALTAIAMPAYANSCPPVPEQEPRKSELMAEVRSAPDERTAKLLTNELWGIWATAPDPHAQEILDEGLERRAAYDFVGAIKAFDALIEYCPDYAEGYNQRAFVAFIRQDYHAALADLNRALSLAPDHIAALAGKALTQIGLGRVAAGQKTLRKALKMNPWLPERHMLALEPDKDI
ncbi:tetratricopeptide repeat protein [Actibacterium lipolyticum]|uniref:Tetratricopeptide repeat protein n=1 Tax=Actibacterium lipolyticum TaxID=1524263 RepID=A0A238JS91_9RHOB|nr:tetratricopeptide repeat protein [Actibacterium lipolyticum]SMX33044.1 Tetratricopeptide repeat protein [Actibacterium lipolyticum]